MDLLNNPDDFRSWLQEHEGHCVGRSGSAYACPVANWLRDRLGEPQILVGCQIAEIDETRVPLPEWAAHFVELIDVRTRGASPYVGAGGALACLKKALDVGGYTDEP